MSVCQLYLTLFLLTLKALQTLKAAGLSKKDHLSSKTTCSYQDLFLTTLENAFKLIQMSTVPNTNSSCCCSFHPQTCFSLLLCSAPFWLNTIKPFKLLWSLIHSVVAQIHDTASSVKVLCCRVITALAVLFHVGSFKKIIIIYCC